MNDRQQCSDEWKELVVTHAKITVYKIRNKAGLYSTGGSKPSWSKRGKTWVALNHVNAHLTLIRTEMQHWQDRMNGTVWTETQKKHMRIHADKSINPYDGCQVVAFEMQEMKSQWIVEGRLQDIDLKKFDKGLNP